MSFFLRSSLSLLVLLAIAAPLVSAASQIWLQQREEIRERRLRIREEAEQHRQYRADAASESIDRLITVANEHRLPGQRDQLLAMCDALDRLDPRRSEAYRQRIDKLPDPDDQSRRLTRRIWQRAWVDEQNAMLAMANEYLNALIKVKATDLAHEFIDELLAFYPDCESLRQALGQRRLGDQWYDPFAYEMALEGFYWDEELGWISHEHHERYERGEYFDLQRSGWTTLEEANTFHADWNHPWEIRTQHLAISSTATLQQTVQCANTLEAFHDEIFAAYAAFFDTNGISYKLILGLEEHRPLTIRIYRSREEMHAQDPRITEWAAGYYRSNTRTSHFPVNFTSIITYHEFTHHIFDVFSSGRSKAPPWVKEAVANYSETPLFDENGELILGDLGNALELRQYLMGAAMPLDDLFALSDREWSDSEDPRKQYATAAAIAQFCMEANDRSMRADFIDFVRESYRGRTSNAVHDFLGMTKTEFSQAFKEWTDSLDPYAVGAQFHERIQKQAHLRVPPHESSRD